MEPTPPDPPPSGSSDGNRGTLFDAGRLQGAPAYNRGPAFTPIRPDEGLLPPVVVAPVAGTPYGLAVVGLTPTRSGPAAASLPLGLASIFAAFVVLGFGALGARDGWGPAVSGAFVLPSVFAAVAALVLGRVGINQYRRGAGLVSGRGVAVAGMVCAVIGLVLAGLAFVFALLIVH